MEQFVNNIYTTLSGAINNSVTSIVVASATGIPATGTFRLLIDDEILICTSRSGTTLTVQRGQENTTAVSHSTGAVVDLVLTKGALDQLRQDISLNLGYSEIPTVIGKTGKIILSSDSYYFFSEDKIDGWTAYGPIHKMTRPVLSGYSWVNQGSATETLTSGHLVLYAPANSGDSYRLRVKTAPSTPYSLIGAFAFTNSGSPVWFGGFIARESSSSKFIALGVAVGGSGFGSICVYKFNNETSFNSVPLEVSLQDVMHLTGQFVWLRYRDDGTNRLLDTSNDGINWFTVYSEGRTVFCTANQYGYGINRNHASEDAYMTIYSYAEG